MEIRNLIKARVILMDSKKQTVLADLPPYDGKSFKYKSSSKNKKAGNIDGIEVRKEERSITGLPDPEEGVIYVGWPFLAADAAAIGRTDVYAVRAYNKDKNGRIEGKEVYANYIEKM